MTQDEEHLKLLAIFHYVVAGIGALIACFPLIHLTVGLLMVNGAFADGKSGPPPAVGWLVIFIAGMVILSGWTLAALIAFAGRCLARRSH